MRSVHSQYDKLSHPERLAVLCRALAREDWAEADRLFASLRLAHPLNDRLRFMQWGQGLIWSMHLIVKEIQRSIGHIEGYARSAMIVHHLLQWQERRYMWMILSSIQSSRPRRRKKETQVQFDERMKVEAKACVAIEEDEGFYDYDKDLASKEMEAITFAEAIHAPLNAATRRVSGLVQGYFKFLQKFIGVDAGIVISSIHPDLWDEIAKVKLDSTPGDPEAIKEAEEIAKRCWRRALTGKSAREE